MNSDHHDRKKKASHEEEAYLQSRDLKKRATAVTTSGGDDELWWSFETQKANKRRTWEKWRASRKWKLKRQALRDIYTKKYDFHVANAYWPQKKNITTAIITLLKERARSNSETHDDVPNNPSNSGILATKPFTFHPVRTNSSNPDRKQKIKARPGSGSWRLRIRNEKHTPDRGAKKQNVSLCLNQSG